MTSGMLLSGVRVICAVAAGASAAAAIPPAAVRNLRRDECFINLSTKTNTYKLSSCVVTSISDFTYTSVMP
jgi:hypothetical protein